MDVNKPVENPELVAAMAAFREQPGPETQGRLFETLRQAHFLLVLQQPLTTEPPGPDGAITLEKGATISLLMLEDGAGRPLHFGFTDWPALYKWREQPDQSTLVVTFDDLAGMVLREGQAPSGLLLNPGSYDYDFFLPPEIVAQASGRVLPYTVEAATPVTLGEPEAAPRSLRNALEAACNALPQVKKAWLLLMEKEGEQSYLVVVKHTGDWAAVSRGIGQGASPHLPQGMFLDLAPADGGFGKEAVQGRKPFFRRGLFG